MVARARRIEAGIQRSVFANPSGAGCSEIDSSGAKVAVTHAALLTADEVQDQRSLDPLPKGAAAAAAPSQDRASPLPKTASADRPASHLTAGVVALTARQQRPPQLSKLATLIQQVGPQVGPLNPVADLVVERTFGRHEAIRMDLGDPIHERRPEAVHGAILPQLLPQEHLH